MIAERTIVGMLLYGHNLNAIIAIFDYSGQHIIFELRIGAHLFCILTHSDVAFINQQRRSLRFEIILLPLVSFLGTPYLC